MKAPPPPFQSFFLLHLFTRVFHSQQNVGTHSSSKQLCCSPHTKQSSPVVVLYRAAPYPPVGNRYIRTTSQKYWYGTVVEYFVSDLRTVSRAPRPFVPPGIPARSSLFPRTDDNDNNDKNVVFLPSRRHTTLGSIFFFLCVGRTFYLSAGNISKCLRVQYRLFSPYY